MPSGVSISDTTIWTTAVRFDSRASAADSNNAASAALDINRGPFRYQVKKTGYYCVGAVPVTISTGAAPSSDDIDSGSSNTTSTTTRTVYTGVVDFENVFKGHLPASEYPKIWFYGALACAYTVIGAVWAFLCYRHRRDILPIQHYVSATILFIIVEMVALSGYYRYLNSSGVGFSILFSQPSYKLTQLCFRRPVWRKHIWVSVSRSNTLLYQVNHAHNLCISLQLQFSTLEGIASAFSCCLSFAWVTVSSGPA